MLVKDVPRKIKRLTFQLDRATVTKAADGGDCVIEGYANTSTKDRVGDVVLPAAFEKTLATYMQNPVLLANHDWNDPCGKVLEAKITDKGLWIKARISDTRPDIKTLINEGCLRTFSIGYNEVVADYDEATKTKFVKELELLEISIVTVPANTEAMFTQATAKAETEAQPKSEGKAAVNGTAAELLAFITDVKAAVGQELTGNQLLAACEYFNDQENEMKTKELLALLRQKSAEQPVAAAKAEPAPVPAGAPAPAQAGDAMPAWAKELLGKLEALAQAVAHMMEQKPADGEKPAEDKPATDKPADAKPADAPKPEGDKDPAADAPAADGEAEEDEEEMDEEEAAKELARLDAEIAALEDAEGI
jgi:HK97 family phage prohead protease